MKGKTARKGLVDRLNDALVKAKGLRIANRKPKDLLAEKEREIQALAIDHKYEKKRAEDFEGDVQKLRSQDHRKEEVINTLKEIILEALQKT